jgi:exodeoxyribonuclease VII large subunit
MMPTIPEGVKVFSITELTSAIEGTLREAFPSVWVSGEVSNCKPAPSGHTYLVLKDAGAQLPAVLWRSVGMRVKFNVKDGMEVLAKGRIIVYAPHGKYQFEIEKVEPKGIGARELALRQLRERLLAKGYFDPRRKRLLPKFPRRIALVTSASGAAVRDMLQVLTMRWTLCDVIVCPVRVQGEEAPSEIAAAIAMLNALHTDRLLEIDVLIVGRGGGSAEDLGAFNEELVADAIYASTIPVISAVGHEIDVTIADLVADDRALTPTDAANRATPDLSEMLPRLRDLRNQMEDAVQHRLELMRQRLAAVASRPAFRLPLGAVQDFEERLDEIATRLQRTMKQKQRQVGEALAAVSGRLETLSPLNVLRRGYSLTRTEGTEELVRDATQIRPGDRLLTTVASGAIVSRVEEVRPAAS